MSTSSSLYLEAASSHPVQRAVACVAGGVRTGLCSQLWFAEEPERRFDLAELRSAVARRGGLDLGFDAGPP